MNQHSGLILGLRPTNERRLYFVAKSLIGLAQALDSVLNILLTTQDKLIKVIP